MSLVALLCLALLWTGTALLLAQLRWCHRPRLVVRLARFTPQRRTTPTAASAGLLSMGSFRDVMGPLARAGGERITRLLGVAESLDVRLRRIGSPLDATSFRLRQLAWAGAAVVAALAAGLALGAPALWTLGGALTAPLLVFLVLEQQVLAASNRRRERTFTELPVVTEQLGMLLGAGYSLGGALARVAARSSGATADDLRQVGNRVRQGLTEVEALREWADLLDLEELHRLVGVLALNQETGDIGQLIADEARTMRREAQRRMVELIERRAQAVWIPVTVATLVPGVMLMAVPFIGAMSAWSAF